MPFIKYIHNILTDVKVASESENIFPPVIDSGLLALSTKRRMFILKSLELDVQSQL